MATALAAARAGRAGGRRLRRRRQHGRGVSDFKTFYAAGPRSLRPAREAFRRHTDELARFLVLSRADRARRGARFGAKHAAGQLRHCCTMNLDRLEESAVPPTKVTYLHGHRDDDARWARTVPAETLAQRGAPRRLGRAQGRARLRPAARLRCTRADPHVEGLRRTARGRPDPVIGTRLKTEPSRHPRRAPPQIVGINDEPIAGEQADLAGRYCLRRAV